MTFSICVHELEAAGDGDDRGRDAHHRFGVAVTTRLPSVGSLCPHASENGAVSTQSKIHVDLGRRGLRYVDEGLAVDDALESLLHTDELAHRRQLHGVDADGTFTHTGEGCTGWCGHLEGDRATGGADNDHYTVAGNLLTGADVVETTAATYEASGRDDRLVARLIDALAAGQDAGGDRREALPIQSAAVVVKTTHDHETRPYYDDLRVDASETPIADLRETYERALEGYETLVERKNDREDE